MKPFLLALCAFSVGALVMTGAETPAPAPVPTPLSAAGGGASTLARTELFFGRISPVQWDEFLTQVVTPKFPDGLTWFDTHGQWQNPTGIVTREDSCVLVLVHVPTPAKDHLIEAIRAEYKVRYHQQSVLRVDQTVTASF